MPCWNFYRGFQVLKDRQCYTLQKSVLRRNTDNLLIFFNVIKENVTMMIYPEEKNA